MKSFVIGLLSGLLLLGQQAPAVASGDLAGSAPPQEVQDLARILQALYDKVTPSTPEGRENYKIPGRIPALTIQIRELFKTISCLN